MRSMTIITAFGIKCLMIAGAIVLLLAGCATSAAAPAKPEPLALFCAPATLTHSGFAVDGLACRTVDETNKAIDEQIQRRGVQPQSAPVVPRHYGPKPDA